MMKRITFDGLFCDIAKCEDTPGGSYCENGTCSQRQVWERLKAIENILGDTYDLEHIRDLLQAEQDGRLVVLDEKTALSMYAGARAIENNKRLFGATYVYDIFGKQGGPQEIPYFDAANNLRNIASAMSLKGGEG